MGGDDAQGELRAAVRALVRAGRLLERGCTVMSLPQYRLLAMVARGDERASRLAQRLAVARPSVSAMVDGLVERRWLSRSAVAGDRRAARIALTPDGCRALEAVEAEMARRLGAVVERAERPADVLAGLAELVRALDLTAAEHLAGSAR